jgi:hypothetical protein
MSRFGFIHKDYEEAMTILFREPYYEARAYGVKTAMVLHEALKLGPKMILVPPGFGHEEDRLL